jgi:hypothetical protein
VDDGVCPTFGNLLLPHSGPGFSPAAAIHGGFSFGGLNPSNPDFIPIQIIFITVKNYFRQKGAGWMTGFEPATTRSTIKPKLDNITAPFVYRCYYIERKIYCQ